MSVDFKKIIELFLTDPDDESNQNYAAKILEEAYSSGDFDNLYNFVKSCHLKKYASYTELLILQNFKVYYILLATAIIYEFNDTFKWLLRPQLIKKFKKDMDIFTKQKGQLKKNLGESRVDIIYNFIPFVYLNFIAESKNKTTIGFESVTDNILELIKNSLLLDSITHVHITDYILNKILGFFSKNENVRMPKKMWSFFHTEYRTEYVPYYLIEYDISLNKKDRNVTRKSHILWSTLIYPISTILDVFIHYRTKLTEKNREFLVLSLKASINRAMGNNHIDQNLLCLCQNDIIKSLIEDNYLFFHTLMTALIDSMTIKRPQQVYINFNYIIEMALVPLYTVKEIETLILFINLFISKNMKKIKWPTLLLALPLPFMVKTSMEVQHDFMKNNKSANADIMSVICTYLT